MTGIDTYADFIARGWWGLCVSKHGAGCASELVVGKINNVHPCKTIFFVWQENAMSLIDATKKGDLEASACNIVA